MSVNFSSDQPAPREGYIPVENARLYNREVGQGQPIIILHGGPDFDQNYLLPEMDRLSDSYRLIYYDQRGRGRSAESVRPEDVSIRSEIEDLEALREYLQLGSAAVLGHSWGGVLAIPQALSGGRLVVLRDCGHFSFIECPDPVHKEIAGFL